MPEMTKEEMKQHLQQTADKALVGMSASDVEGFWRSATGENHERKFKPGDEWVTADTVTDTDRLRWAVQHFDAYDWYHLPEDFGQAREYIDAQMMEPQNERKL